jgi:preprotein translocase subunit SecF
MVFSQEKNDVQTLNEISRLKRIVGLQNIQIKSLETKNNELQQKLIEISNNLDQKLIHNLELQAQNERAINITLDEFSMKFEQQNKTVDGVKSTLDKQLVYQIIFYVIGLIVFVIILIITNRISVKRALAKQEQNWNSFNEHILKQ